MSGRRTGPFTQITINGKTYKDESARGTTRARSVTGGGQKGPFTQITIKGKTYKDKNAQVTKPSIVSPTQWLSQEPKAAKGTAVPTKKTGQRDRAAIEADMEPLVGDRRRVGKQLNDLQKEFEAKGGAWKQSEDEVKRYNLERARLMGEEGSLNRQIEELNKELKPIDKAEGRTLPQQIARTVKGAIKAVPAGLEGTVGSQANAATTLYATGQGGRDRQGRELLEEYRNTLEKAKRDLTDMQNDSNVDPRDLRSQGYIVEDARRKYDALAKVMDEDVQRKATDASFELADQIAADSARRIEKAKEGLMGPGRVVVDATASTVQTLGDLAANTALGTPQSMLPFAFRAFGGATQEARQDGADLKGQLVYGGLSTAKEIFTEKLFGLAMPFSEAYGGGSLDDVTEKAIERAVERFANTEAGKRMLRGGLDFATGAASEGLEEFIGDWLEWQLPRVYGGDPATAGETLENSLYDFMVGTVSGAMGDGVSGVTNYAAEDILRRMTEGEGQSGAGALEALAREMASTEEEKAASVEGAVKANTSLFDHGILENFNSARKKLVEFAKTHFPSSVVNAETGRTIGISRRGLDKFLSGNIPFEKYASGFHIPELIERAHKVSEATNYHTDTAESIPTFEYFDSPIEINGRMYNAHIRVKNTLVGDKYYGHTVSEVEDIKIEYPTRTSASETPTVQPENTGYSTNISIPQDGVGVKQGGEYTAMDLAVEMLAGQGENAPLEAAAEVLARQGETVALERTVPLMSRDAKWVAEFSKTLGKAGATVFTQMYDPGISAEVYIQAMHAYYNAGMSEGSMAAVYQRLGDVVTPQQASAAYMAGQADATARLNAEKQAATAQAEEAAEAPELEGADNWAASGEPMLERTTYQEWDDEQVVRNAQGSVEIERQKLYNERADRAQYEEYVDRLGDDAPASFDEFQTMKYQEPEAWAETKSFFDYKGIVPEATKGDFQMWKKIKETGVKGTVRVPPEPVDASILEFLDAHGTRHGITLEQAREYVRTARFSITRYRWDGKKTNFYSPTGATYINAEGKINTSFPREEFDPITEKAMGVYEE